MDFHKEGIGMLYSYEIPLPLVLTFLLQEAFRLLLVGKIKAVTYRRSRLNTCSGFWERCAQRIARDH